MKSNTKEFIQKAKSKHGDLYDLFIKTTQKDELIKKSGYKLITIWEMEYKRKIRQVSLPDFP